MKAIYKCEYCKLMGTEEEIAKHEEICIFNHDKKGCYTCLNMGGNICSPVCEKGYFLDGKARDSCKDYIQRIGFGWNELFK